MLRILTFIVTLPGVVMGRRYLFILMRRALGGRGGRLTRPAPPKHAQHSREPPVTHAAALTDAPVLG